MYEKVIGCNTSTVKEMVQSPRICTCEFRENIFKNVFKKVNICQYLSSLFKDFWYQCSLSGKKANFELLIWFSQSQITSLYLIERTVRDNFF